MSWLRIDDGFTENAKVVGLSDGALALWMRCACWAQRPENQHTKGVIPRAIVDKIGRTSKAKAKKLAEELVGANAGGTKANGLWEEHELGWRFHDWEKYQPEKSSISEKDNAKLTRSEQARMAGLKSAEARRQRRGSAQPLPNEFRTNSNDRSERNSTTVRTTVPNETQRPFERDSTPDPVPNPRNTLKTAAKELLPGSSNELNETRTKSNDRSNDRSERTPNETQPAKQQQQVVSGKIPFPSDLQLTQGQKNNLKMLGASDAGIDRIFLKLKSKLCADEETLRTEVEWKKYCAAAISRIWSDPKQRPTPEELEVKTDYDLKKANEDRRRKREAAEARMKAEAREKNKA